MTPSESPSTASTPPGPPALPGVTRSELKVLIGCLCAWRVLFLLLLLAALLIWPTGYEIRSFEANFHRNPQPLPGLARHFETWDAQAYLLIAERGYAAAAGTKAGAFFPLWPALVATGAATGLPSVWAGVVLANALSVAALTVVYLVLRLHFAVGTARRALCLLLAYPGALFLAFPYTEALFLLLSGLVLLALGQPGWPLRRTATIYKDAMPPAGLASSDPEAGPAPGAAPVPAVASGWLLAAAVAAFLAPLCRPPGLLLVIPMAWAWWQFDTAARRRTWWLPLLPVLGYVVYLGLMHRLTGDALVGLHAQALYKARPSLQRLVDVPGFVAAFAHAGNWHGFRDSVIDRACFVLFLITLPELWRRDRIWFAYVLPMGLMPAMTAAFMSFNRYFLVAFPCFLVLSIWSERDRTRVLYGVLVGLLGLLQAWFLWRHANFYWAG